MDYGQAVPFVALDGITDTEWRAARRSGVGGSDVAPIVGHSPFSDALRVWADKHGLWEWEPNEPAYWGHELEDKVLAELAKRSGMTILRPTHMLHHPEFRWAIANLDGWGTHPDLPGWGVAEAKTCSAFTATDWHGAPDAGATPWYYELQVQWYMAITGAAWSLIGVLIGGNDYRWRLIPANEAIQVWLLDAAHDFWHDHVLTGHRPPAIGRPDVVADTLNAVHATGQDRAVDIDHLADQYAAAVDLRAALADGDAELTRLKNALKEAMGDAEEARIAGRLVARWKAPRNGGTRRFTFVD